MKMNRNESVPTDILRTNKLRLLKQKLVEEKECLWLESMESVQIVITSYKNEYRFLSSGRPIINISSDEDN